METHTPTNRSSQNQPTLPNQPFFSWVRTQTGLLTSQIIGLLSVVSVPIALYYYYKHSLVEQVPGQPPGSLHWQELERVGQYVIYAHLFCLVLFIGILLRGLYKNNIGNYRAGLVHEKLKGPAEDRSKLADFSTRQVGRFKRRFLGFWCSMLCLYLVFAVEPMFSVTVEDCLQTLGFRQMFRTEFVPILSFALNNLSLIFVFCCFSVLYLPLDATADQAHAPIPKDAGTSRIKRLWLRFYGLRARLIKKFSDKDIDGRELRQRTLVVTFILLIVALTLTFPLIMLTKWGVKTNWSEYPAVFGALSGTINAMVMALLVARLDSKLIGLPSWLICLLYFYAGVQPMFVVFELRPEEYAGIRTAVLWVVFIFKIYFFLVIFYSLQTGRLFNYFYCSKALNDLIERLKTPAQAESVTQTPPEGSVEEKTVKPSIDVASQHSSSEIQQSPPVNAVTDDPRELWFKRIGVAAIVYFAVSLLVYVALPENYKEWVDRSGLSNTIVILNLILLLLICGFIVNAWLKEHKHGFRPTEDSRSRVRSELLFELRDPEAQIGARTSEGLSLRTTHQFRSFTFYFKLFWGSLAVLYVVMWFSGPVMPIESKDCPPKTEQLLLTNEAKKAVPEANAAFSSGPITEAVFFERDHTAAYEDQKRGRTPVKESEPASGAEVHQQRLSIWQLPATVKFSYLFFVLNNSTVLILFLCFTVLYIPADDPKFNEKYQLLRISAVLIAVLLTILIPLLAVVIKGNVFTPSDATKIPTILGAVGGTLNAVAFALLIARLDSRLIGLRLLLVTVLYAYAALQPLFVTFNQPSNLLRFIATSAMVAVFVFKVCLVLMVGHVRRSGGLIDYLWFFPVVSKSVNSIFGNQFEIKAYSPKPGLFTFSIFNKNVQMYRASEMFNSRVQVDDAIRTLVNAMQKRENYGKLPQKLQGTYWVQVKSGERLLCESVGLSSQTQVDELINESIEKVPYCKYDRG